MQRRYLQHRCSATASSTDKMAMWRRHKGLRSPMAMAWSSTGDEVSCSEKGSGCAAPRWWKVASTMLNAVGSSPNGGGCGLLLVGRHRIDGILLRKESW
jgi:hypothetical protein